jgi:hypothetical protein
MRLFVSRAHIRPSDGRTYYMALYGFIAIAFSIHLIDVKPCQIIGYTLEAQLEVILEISPNTRLKQRDQNLDEILLMVYRHAVNI